MTDAQQVQKLVDATLAEFGRIDVRNNAGGGDTSSGNDVDGRGQQGAS